VTGNSASDAGITGSLRVVDGKGAVRVEARFEAGTGDVWSALTDPARLARWYGEVEGDFRVGGEYLAHLFASGWEGAGRIEACQAERRLVVTGAEPGDEDGTVTEVTLAADSGQTLLVWEERGMTVDGVGAYGAGVQIHVEDLAAHLAGRDRCDAEARFNELEPVYDALASKIG
jgi:uncharacterized protein YndB with AHSA1/START domain